MGAKPGGMKGNEQEAEYEEPGEKARETGWNGSGGARKPKGREAALDGAAVRRRGEDEERKKQKAK